jgi:deaminated glutathione amidase
MRVAAVQTTAGPDRDKNLDAAAALVEGAATDGAGLVVLPEYFSVAGGAHLRAHAEPLTGPTATWASRLAARLGVALVAGTFPERSADPAGKLSNTSCLMGPTGALEAVYRKIHLFDVEMEGTTVHESAVVAAGDRLCVAPPGVLPATVGPAPVLGMSVCYDLRFPELYRILALEGATVVSVPAAFTAATGPPHWELLLRARAVENQVYVVAAAQVGELPPGMPACHGHSMVVDPWGDILAEQVDDAPGYVVADVDLGRLEQVRAQLPVLAHRRPDTYRWPDGR